MAQTIEFNLPLRFGDKAEARRAWSYTTKWEALTKDDLMRMTIGSFALGEGRFIVELLIEGQPCRITTNDEDYQQIRAKYPQDICIHARQVYEIFRETILAKDTLPRLLLPVGVLNGTIESKTARAGYASTGKPRKKNY
jgi:hypothetical protein